MGRSKKTGKEPVSKKAKSTETDNDKPAKKTPVKAKDKNWKNHLLDDADEEEKDEDFDSSPMEDFQNFDDSFDDDDDDF